MITHAVVRICCDRADGIEYFSSYDEAAAWRSEYESRDKEPEPFPHLRTGVLLSVTGVCPPHIGLEDGQIWVWLGDHWEVEWLWRTTTP